MDSIVRELLPRLLFLGILAEMLLPSCWAQDLAPRAYLITPLHSNAINLTYGFNSGALDFNGVVPINGATKYARVMTVITDPLPV